MTGTAIDYLLVFIVTLGLLKLLARVALKVGLVDTPGRRKRHRGKIPLIGGPAILAGIALGALLTVDFLYSYRALFAALTVLVIAGLLDDLRDLAPRQKFAAQLIAGLIMVTWGHTMVYNLGDLFGFGQVSLPNWAVPFTVVALLGLINAINMADGADGLAGGLSFIALAFLAIGALATGKPVSAQFLTTAAVVVAAFLLLNARWPWQAHATIFMGDSGSMLLGGLLTWFSVEVARVGSGVPPIVAVWFLAVPLLDMGVIIGRRLAKGQSPFKGGRDHLHHVLIAAGLKPGEAVLVIHLAAVVLAALAFVAWRAKIPEFVLFYVFLAFLSASYFMSSRWKKVIRAARRKRRWAKAPSSNRIASS
jgi:UDP-GlcNAc:undecaprenyl-phosphate GlcNAc-1-phosphate transferase